MSIRTTLALQGAPVVVSAMSAVPVPATTILCTTGALPAGDYFVEVTMGYADTALAGKGMSCEHRNAANNATVAELGLCPAQNSFAMEYQRVTLAVNEIIQVSSLAVAGAAGSIASATIRAYKLPPA